MSNLTNSAAESPVATPISTKANLVVIGNGMVGHHFIEKAIEQGLHE